MTVKSKRTIKIHGHGTSVSVEDAYWKCLKEIADKECLPLYMLIEKLEDQYYADKEAGKEKSNNFSGSLRIVVLEHYQKLAEKSRRARALAQEQAA